MSDPEKKIASKPSDYPPIGYVFGDVDAGKTVEVAGAFPDYVGLTTSPTALASLEDYLAKYPDEAKERKMAFPKHVLNWTPEKRKNGNAFEYLVDWEKKWFDFWTSWETNAKAGKLIWPGAFVDETDTLFKAVYDCVKKHHPGWDGNDLLIDHVKYAIDVSRRCKTGLIFVSHKAYPVVHDKGPKEGTLKYKGGPKGPIGGLIETIGKELDFVWELVVEGSADTGLSRKFLCSASDDILRKTRRMLGDEGSVRIIDAHKGLREHIREVGFRV